MMGVLSIFTDLFKFLSQLRTSGIFRLFDSKYTQVIKDLSGKWHYKLTYSSRVNNKNITVQVLGSFRLDTQRYNGNRIFINGQREEIKLCSSSSCTIINLSKETSWNSDWVEYCHDGKIRFLYSFLIFSDVDFNGDNEVKILVESNNFCKGDREILGRQYPFAINEDILSFDIEFPNSDLRIPYLTFLRDAKLIAEKA